MNAKRSNFERLLTHPLRGPGEYAEMIRRLTEQKSASTVFGDASAEGRV